MESSFKAVRRPESKRVPCTYSFRGLYLILARSYLAMKIKTKMGLSKISKLFSTQVSRSERLATSLVRMVLQSPARSGAAHGRAPEILVSKLRQSDPD
jgi:hypothetical protein